MKNKYIYGMIAGLMVLGSASCDKEGAAAVKDVAEKAAESATSTAKAAASEGATAYYVMFKGKG